MKPPIIETAKPTVSPLPRKKYPFLGIALMINHLCNSYETNTLEFAQIAMWYNMTMNFQGIHGEDLQIITDALLHVDSIVLDIGAARFGQAHRAITPARLADARSYAYTLGAIEVDKFHR